MDARHDQTWDEVHRAIVPLMRANNRTNWVYLAREYVFLGMMFWAGTASYSAWSSGHLGTLAFATIALMIVVMVAVLQHRLSGLAHDASHYVLFRNRLANELVSDIFLMFPIVAMTQVYRASHLGHHQFVNDPDRDPDLVRLKGSDHDFPLEKARFWQRYVLKGLWPLTMLPYLFGRAKAANLSGVDEPELRSVYCKKVARCLRGTYWLSLFTAIHALHAWPVFLLFWVLPLLTIYPFLMQLREIAHHSNAPDDGDLTNSRVFVVNPVLAAAVFPYGQAFHLTHHLFAMVPHYRVAEVHALLMQNGEYRDRVVICRGYFFRTIGTSGPSVLDVLAQNSLNSWLRGPIVQKAAGRSGRVSR
jgi:fatty acid desaturase